MRASATPATRAPTATPTLSTARPSAPAPRGIQGQPAARTWMSVLWVGADTVAQTAGMGWLSHMWVGCDLSWRTTILMAWAGAFRVVWRLEGQMNPHPCLSHQVPTLVSTQASASTHWVLLSASVYRATRDPAVRLMSMSASLTHVRMMPLVWTRLGSSNAYVCQVCLMPFPTMGAAKSRQQRNESRLHSFK